jgi:hypothetical protein
MEFRTNDAASNVSWSRAVSGVGQQPIEADGGDRHGKVLRVLITAAAAGNPRQSTKRGTAISMSHALLFQID